MDANHLQGLVEKLELPPAERERLVRLMLVLGELPKPPDPIGLFPEYEALQGTFLESADGPDPEALEESFLSLYCHLHGHEAPYTGEERRRVDRTGGYWCHAGGLSPILRADPFIDQDTVFADYGAGNGLQGLLTQILSPHRKTVQIEISSRMVEAGRALQSWLDIPAERIEWVVGDVLDYSPQSFDFIYLYRPVRPSGEGLRFYQRFQRDLTLSDHPLVIFSVADCLGPFLPPGFEVIHFDGHLTCYQRR